MICAAICGGKADFTQRIPLKYQPVVREKSLGCVCTTAAVGFVVQQPQAVPEQQHSCALRSVCRLFLLEHCSVERLCHYQRIIVYAESPLVASMIRLEPVLR